VDAELASLVSDIAIIVSAVVVAIVGGIGLRTWRRAMTGKAKFDVARNVMLLGFKLKADFEWVRNPFTRSWESADRPRQENETPGESSVLNEWYAKGRRLQPLVENLQKFQELSWEAETLLSENSGRCVSEVLAVYRHSYAELASAIESYFDIGCQGAVTGIPYKDQDWLKGLHKEIYSAKDDDFFKRIDEATKQLAPALKAYVK